MAIWKRTVLDAPTAQALLGEAWIYAGQGLEYYAFSRDERSRDFQDYRTDLIAGKLKLTVSGRTITSRHIWPKDLKLSIEADGFHTDENGQVMHPLLGHPMKRLIVATNYPFHNPDHVVAIPIRYISDKGSSHLINPSNPNAVLFIETWTFFDPYDTAKYSTASAAFNIIDVDAAGILWSEQIYDVDHQIGRNFIILPFGYCHYIAFKGARYTTEEWVSFYAKYSDEWKRLIQDYFDGINQDEILPDPKTFDESNIMGFSLEEWQTNLRNSWRQKFLSRQNIDIIKHNEEAFLEETQNGVILRIITEPSLTEEKANQNIDTEYECFNGIRYTLHRYSYCCSHYQKFINKLAEIQSDLMGYKNAIHRAEK